MGTSQSHELEHCERTVHVPAGVITGKLSGKFKMYLQCSRWVHCWYTVHFLVMYLQCSWWEHHYLPPVSVIHLSTASNFALNLLFWKWMLSRLSFLQNIRTSDQRR